MKLGQFEDDFKVKRDECEDPNILMRSEDVKGHIYEHGEGKWGIWIETSRPESTFKSLRRRFPDIQKHQIGEIESTFILPVSRYSDATEILRGLKAHRVEYRVVSEITRDSRKRAMQAMNAERRGDRQLKPVAKSPPKKPREQSRR